MHYKLQGRPQADGETVGKTSLITRFMYDSFDNTYQATIGIDFLSKVRYPAASTILRERKNLRKMERLTGTDNVSRRPDDDVRDERGNDVIIALVGNKTDLNDKREVTTEQGEEEAKKNGLMFIETSAKLGHNVKNLFKKIAQALPGMEGETPNSDNQSMLSSLSDGMLSVNRRLY
ncbi:uncharacterized protein ARB_06291 [Trichophyton benhamiae CBS 112371]|uniref:RAS small monomeric GTPase Rab6 n=1 Tax=Arthroderma benhamiae (strain ATCC MYA-4681 / CBS 112371) TaxID=663331 RepID=D4APY4_ARTBC|nr:uncharacterized protein ARB_06291 [Trichophyton benhamiae CBS 112371]EFE34528.1 hypothetical protein ARB_06291 [Trichophyton benhamiae CBS 112371]